MTTKISGISKFLSSTQSFSSSASYSGLSQSKPQRSANFSRAACCEQVVDLDQAFLVMPRSGRSSVSYNALNEAISQFRLARKNRKVKRSRLPKQRRVRNPAHLEPILESVSDHSATLLDCESCVVISPETTSECVAMASVFAGQIRQGKKTVRWVRPTVPATQESMLRDGEIIVQLTLDDNLSYYQALMNEMYEQDISAGGVFIITHHRDMKHMVYAYPRRDGEFMRNWERVHTPVEDVHGLRLREYFTLMVYVMSFVVVVGALLPKDILVKDIIKCKRVRRGKISVYRPDSPSLPVQHVRAFGSDPYLIPVDCPQLKIPPKQSLTHKLEGPSGPWYGNPLAGKRCAAYALLWALAARLHWPGLTYTMRAFNNKMLEQVSGASGKKISATCANDCDLEIDAYFKKYWPQAVRQLDSLQPFASVNAAALVDTPLMMRILEAIDVEWSFAKIGAGSKVPIKLAEYTLQPKIAKNANSPSSSTGTLTGICLTHSVSKQTDTVTYHWVVDLKELDKFPKSSTKASPPTAACFANAIAASGRVSCAAVQKSIELYRKEFGMPAVRDGGGAETTFDEARFVLENHDLNFAIVQYSATTFLPYISFGDPCTADAIIGHNTHPAQHWFLVQNQYRSALGWCIKKDTFAADIYYLPEILQSSFGKDPKSYPNALDWKIVLDAESEKRKKGNLVLTSTTTSTADKSESSADVKAPEPERTVHDQWTESGTVIKTCDYRLPQWPLFRLMMRTVLEHIGFPDAPFLEAAHDYSRPLEFLKEVAQAQAWQSGVSIPGPLKLSEVSNPGNRKIWSGLTRHGDCISEEQFLHCPIAVTVGENNYELYSGLEVRNWEELQNSHIVWWVPVSPHYRFVYYDESRTFSRFNPLFQCSSWAFDLLRSETDAVSKSLLEPSRRAVLVNRTVQYSKFKCLGNTILSKGEADILGDLGHAALTEQMRVNAIAKSEVVREGLVKPRHVQFVCDELQRNNVTFSIEELEGLLIVMRSGVLAVKKFRRTLMKTCICTYVACAFMGCWTFSVQGFGIFLISLLAYELYLTKEKSDWFWLACLYIQHYMPDVQKSWCMDNLDEMQEERSFNLYRPNRLYHQRKPLFRTLIFTLCPFRWFSIGRALRALFTNPMATVANGDSEGTWDCSYSRDVSAMSLCAAEMECFWEHFISLSQLLIILSVLMICNVFVYYYIVINFSWLTKEVIQSGLYLEWFEAIQMYCPFNLGWLLWSDPADFTQYLLGIYRNRKEIVSHTISPWLVLMATVVTYKLIRYVLAGVGILFRRVFGMDKGIKAKAYGLDEPLSDMFMDITDERFMSIQSGNRTARGIKYHHPDGSLFPDFEAAKAFMRTHVDTERSTKRWYRTGLKAHATSGEVKPFILKQSSRNLFHAFHDRQVGIRSMELPYWANLYSEIADVCVKRWVEGVLSYWNEHGLMSEEEYIDSVPASKGRVYKLGLLRWDEQHKIDAKLELRQKSGEPHFDHPNKLRGRCFFNPGPVYKVLTGCYNKNVITAMRMIEPAFVHGLDCSGLEDKLTTLWQSVENPCFGDADGSSHDAHEHAWKIACVDHIFHKLVLDEYCARMGYDSLKTSELKRVLLSSEYEFEAYYLGSRNKMISGTLYGSVFSGASTLTTDGNTKRTIVAQELVRFIAGLSRNNLAYGQAGDDQLQIITQKFKTAYDHASRQVYLKEESMGGIGYLVKVQNWGGNIFSFLSKTGGAAADRVVAHRMWHRTIIGGNYTHKLKRNFTSAHHRWAINSQLASWIGDLPIFGSYLEARKALPTAIPKSRDILWNDPERFWKSVSHANEHAGPNHYEPMRPFLYGSAFSVYNEYVNTPGFYDLLEGVKYCG